MKKFYKSVKMLPNSSIDNTDYTTMGKVYINPNFKAGMRFSTTQQLQMLLSQQQRYKRPLSHEQPPHSIHINPKVLQKRLFEQQLHQQRQRQEALHSKWAQAVASQVEVLTPSPTPAPMISITKHLPTVNSAKIISKARTKLVRNVSGIPKETITIKKRPRPVPIPIVASPTVAPLISISRRKLVRRHNTTVLNTTTKKTTAIPSLNKTPVIAASNNKYKLDRRCGNLTTSLVKLKNQNKKPSFVARYALRRGVACQVIDEKIGSASKYHKSIKPSTSSNRSLQLLNINGVLYKSTRNKLQRKVSTSSAHELKGSTKGETAKLQIKYTIPKNVLGRTLFVRGTKFVMDKNGFKLTRLPGNGGNTYILSQLANSTKSSTAITKAASYQRIDIGGLTYVASSASQNVFVRTSNHVSRAHLNTAKQRSLQQLNRPLVKTNVPCAIFQRLGKCIANERNKCRKVHDKRQVAVCAGFLRGDCNKINCLLSHNVSLSKMPVCKFFLQALCVREDCPYLHKKLSNDAEFCTDFLRGYCPLAEKCNKRHEFLCPEYERKGKCEITNCLQCKQMRLHAQRLVKRQQQQQQQHKQRDEEKHQSGGAAAAVNRYFDAQLDEEEIIKVSDDELTKEEDEVHKPDDYNDEHCKTDEDSNADDDDDEGEDEIVIPKYKQRVKLGVLPSYIPLS